MEYKYPHPTSLVPLQTKYCPGCGHGIIHKLIASVVDELGVQSRSIIFNPVGCSIFANLYLDFDSVQVPHGRTPAGATGLKRVLPDHLVICYQGDGDLAAIGTGEMIHAANRGEKFTTIFVNNAIYAMTGGQTAPTSLLTQSTSTNPKGRDVDGSGQGFPMKICELLACLDGTTYLARGSVDNANNVRKTRQYIKTAFEAQLRGLGFTMVEILSPCPTNWGMNPANACDWVANSMVPLYPLGEIKNTLSVIS